MIPNEVKQTIEKQLDDSMKLVETFHEYFEKLKPLLEEKYEDESNQLSQILARFSKQHAAIVSMLGKSEQTSKSDTKSDTKQIINIFEFYDCIETFYASMSSIIDQFNRPFMTADSSTSSDLSQTYKIETMDYLNKVLKQYDVFNKKYQALNDNIIEILSDSLLDIIKKETSHQKDSLKDSLSVLQKTFLSHTGTVTLYSITLQKIINHLYTVDKPSMFYVLSLIEEDKDYFLTANIKNKLPNSVSKTIHISNPSLKRFRLVPVTECLPLDKLFDILNPSSSSSGSSSNHKKINLSSYAKTHKLGIIQIIKCTYDPIEYNIRSLIVPEIASQYAQPSQYGITERTVKRFQTIKELSKLGGNADNEPTRFNIIDELKIQFLNSEPSIDADDTANDTADDTADDITEPVVSSIDETGNGLDDTLENLDDEDVTGGHDYKWNFAYEIHNPDSESFYVIESLDGITYRALAPWLIAKNLLLPKFRVVQLLKYITDGNPPNRITGYHSSACRKAIPNMFLERALDIDYLEEQSKDIDTYLIKNELYLKLTKLVNSMITSRIKSSIDINNILHDESIRTTLNDTILRFYTLSVAKDYSLNSFAGSELLSSFLVSLADITRQFMKNLHDGYNRNPLEKEIFEQSGDSKVSTITKRLDELVHNTLNLIINTKENIYQMVNYKYLLLNFK